MAIRQMILIAMATDRSISQASKGWNRVWRQDGKAGDAFGLVSLNSQSLNETFADTILNYKSPKFVTPGSVNPRAPFCRYICPPPVAPEEGSAFQEPQLEHVDSKRSLKMHDSIARSASFLSVVRPSSLLHI